jgi:hypothetical protein
MKLPKAEQNLPEWQAATEALIMAAEGRGPLMQARVGVLRALNRNVERVFNPDRKETEIEERSVTECATCTGRRSATACIGAATLAPTS